MLVGGERVEPGPLVAQFGGQFPERRNGVDGSTRGHDRQRQRQACAPRDDLRHRVQLGRHPVGAEAADQQVAGLGRLSRSSPRGCAPSVATRPRSWLRLVTRTTQHGAPGSSGRTWAASRAFSRTMSIRRVATMLRRTRSGRRGRSARAPGDVQRVEEVADASAGSTPDRCGRFPLI